jgi:hypothetical protein
VTYRNCPLPKIEDKLVFILMYLRKATTQDIFGEVFGISQPVANKWIHVLHPCLRMALTVLGAIPRPNDQEIQRLFYSAKGKSHTIKNVSDEAGFELPSGSCLYQDTGFQGFALEGVNIVQPKKEPRGKKLTRAEQEANHQISSVRVRVEHAIGGVKRYRIVKDKIRNWKDDFRDQVIDTCGGLHNFRLDFRPWHYDPISVNS